MHRLVVFHWSLKGSKYPQVSIAQSAGAVEYIDCTSVEGLDPTPKECAGYGTKIWWWVYSNGGPLQNAEYSFTAITPRSTLA